MSRWDIFHLSVSLPLFQIEMKVGAGVVGYWSLLPLREPTAE